MKKIFQTYRWWWLAMVAVATFTTIGVVSRVLFGIAYLYGNDDSVYAFLQIALVVLMWTFLCATASYGYHRNKNK